MNAMPPNFPPASRAPVAPPADFAADAMANKWAALQEAAQLVAGLAGVTPKPATAAIRNFPAAMQTASDWRREHAEKGIDDLAAIMEAGLAALLAIHARGGNAEAPAIALWREFTAARTALLALAPISPNAGAPARP